MLGSGVSCMAFAIDLYVDTKTEQIYAKPGPGRVHMGSFVREDAPENSQATRERYQLVLLQREPASTAEVAAEEDPGSRASRNP